MVRKIRKTMMLFIVDYILQIKEVEKFKINMKKISGRVFKWRIKDCIRLCIVLEMGKVLFK